MQFKVRLLGCSAVAVMSAASLLLTAGVGSATAAADPGAGQFLPAPAVPSAPVAAVAGATQVDSANWSGYAQSGKTKGKFKAVKDYWTVPTVNTAQSGKQYSSDWVGIGGYSENTLVQDGTEADNAGGTAKYDAWTEILPAPEVVIPGLTIRPGDKMEGLVEETSAGVWNMTVFDLTTGASGGRTVSYNSSGQSVEAIHERPQVGGVLATLAKTPNVTFDPGSFSIASPGTQTWKPLLKPASGATLNEIFMTNNNGTAVIAAPSRPDSDNDGFAVAYGSTSPPPPKS
jgi:hypothetical protein